MNNIYRYQTCCALRRLVLCNDCYKNYGDKKLVLETAATDSVCDDCKSLGTPQASQLAVNQPTR